VRAPAISADYRSSSGGGVCSQRTFLRSQSTTCSERCGKQTFVERPTRTCQRDSAASLRVWPNNALHRGSLSRSIELAPQKTSRPFEAAVETRQTPITARMLRSPLNMIHGYRSASRVARVDSWPVPHHDGERGDLGLRSIRQPVAQGVDASESQRRSVQNPAVLDDRRSVRG
jgi:hypothetical protein